MANINWRSWKDIAKKLVDRQYGTFAERIEAYPPKVLMTDSDGAYARLSVDIGSTGFYAGREFRTFYEYSVAPSATQVIKVVAPINVLIRSMQFELDVGELRVEVRLAGTESGTWATNLPIIAANSMSSVSSYLPQVTISTGGTHTGGTIIDLYKIFLGASAKQTAGEYVAPNSPLAFAPRTVYIKMQNTSLVTASGIFRRRWEEIP